MVMSGSKIVLQTTLKESCGGINRLMQDCQIILEQTDCPSKGTNV